MGVSPMSIPLCVACCSLKGIRVSIDSWFRVRLIGLGRQKASA